jgi:hypothetical protein
MYYLYVKQHDRQFLPHASTSATEIGLRVWRILGKYSIVLKFIACPAGFASHHPISNHHQRGPHEVIGWRTHAT